MKLEFDVRHVAGTSYVDIEQRSATAFDLELDGVINNPVGLTRIINLHGSITASSTGLVKTNQLDVDAVEGSIGSSSARLKVDLITFVLRAYNGGPSTGERVSRLLAQAGTDVFLSLRGVDRRQFVVAELTIFIDRVEAGRDLDLELRDTARQPGSGGAADIYVLATNESGFWSSKQDARLALPRHRQHGSRSSTTRTARAASTRGIRPCTSARPPSRRSTASTSSSCSTCRSPRTNVNFLTTGLKRYRGDLRSGRVRDVRRRRPTPAAESPGLIAGRHIDVRDTEGLTQGDDADDLNVGPTIRIFGYTNLKDVTPGWLDVNVKGSVELKEVLGDMRVGIVRSRTSDVKLTAAVASILDAATGEIEGERHRPARTSRA